MLRLALVLLCCLAADRAHAYSLTGTRWLSASTTMQLQLGANATPLADGSSSWNAVAENALTLWNGHLGGFRFNVVRDSLATRAQGNRVNNVHFAPDIYGTAWSNGVLAVTLTYYSGSANSETDVVFNSRLNWDSYRGSTRFNSNGQAVYDFHRVALHEFGHALGLDHPDEDGQAVSALMNSRISTLDTLTLDDIAGGQSLYGAPAVVAPPAITSQPASRSVTAGQGASFTVVASGSAPLAYQWMKSGSPLNGATASTLTFASVTTSDAGSYTVAVTNSAGTTTSHAATLTVTAAAPSTPTTPMVAPAVVTQPSSRFATAGQSVTFTIAASGTAPLSYQWQKNGATIPGATNATLTLASVQPSDAGNYRVMVANAAGSVPSADATLTITSLPVIVQQPLDRGAAIGSSVTLTTIATSGAPLAYQWRKDGAALPGATQSSYTIGSVTTAHAGGYSVLVTNTAGSVSSATARLTVGTAPAITRHPLSQVLRPGERLSLSVAAAGSPEPTYQWFKDNNVVAGGISPTLIIDSATPASAGVYHVVASNPIGSAASATAAVTVDGLPTISASPLPQTVDVGQRLELSVVADAAPSPAFQWLRDGVELAGATQPRLVIAAARVADAGVYRVRVSNAAGSVLSAEAPVMVRHSRLANLSTRAFVPAGGTLTPGFFIRGSTAKAVVVRAVGPSLSLFGVGAALGETKLEVIAQDNASVVATNNDWGGGSELSNSFARVGAFPLAADSKDAALATSLTPRGYTARIAAGDNALSGITLAEIYDADSAAAAAQLVNVSTLGFVGRGEDALTAGFVISGDAPKRLLIRAVGPGLGAFGVGDALPNPQLALVPQGRAEPLATNDDWPDLPNLRAAFSAAGAFTLETGSHDAALVITLEPGAYTVVVSSADGATTGNALVEIYDLDP
jgi:hypothetical protein